MKNDPVKYFKICHILGIRKPVGFSIPIPKNMANFESFHKHELGLLISDFGEKTINKIDMCIL